MNRTACEVTLGMTALGGDTPITCVPFGGAKVVYCYATKEQEALFGERNSMRWWCEWNGVSFDLIEPMTAEEVEAEIASFEEVPF